MLARTILRHLVAITISRSAGGGGLALFGNYSMEMERWRDGEMERWKDGKMERKRVFVFVFIFAFAVLAGSTASNAFMNMGDSPSCNWHPFIGWKRCAGGECKVTR
jgi:hypothetical protein